MSVSLPAFPLTTRTHASASPRTPAPAGCRERACCATGTWMSC